MAFKGAIRRCFNGCTHVLCTRHLKENTDRYLENIVGVLKSDRNTILDAIYGQNGLLETRGPKGPWVAHLRTRSKVTVEPFTEDH